MIGTSTLGTVLLVASLAPQETRHGIAWAKDLASAEAAAARDDRPVLLYFSFDT